MKRCLTIACLWLLPLAVFAAEWDLGPSRWQVDIDPTYIDEDTGIVVIDLSQFPSSFWSTVNSTDGRDIRVTSDDADTQLPAYWAGFSDSGTTGTGWLFVDTSVSTSATTTLYVYAGDGAAVMPAVGSTYGRNAAMAEFAAFYLPGMTTTDLTGNGYDLTAVNSPGTAASDWGGITAADYNGTDQYHKHEGTLISDWPMTLGCLAYTDSDALRQTITGLQDEDDLSQAEIVFRGNQTGDPIRTSSSGATPNYALTTGSGYSTGTWYDLGLVVFDDGNYQAEQYTEGALDDSALTSGSSPLFDIFAIGVRPTTTPNWYTDGRVALVYLCDSKRSANWISTWYNFWNAPASVVTVGTEETEPAGSGETAWVEMTVTATESTNAGQSDWTNPGQSLTSLANAATSDIPKNSESYRLKLLNPDGALDEVIGKTPTGIAWEIVGTGEDGGSGPGEQYIQDHDIRLIVGGNLTGDDKTCLDRWSDSAQITREYGGEGDMWGTSGVTGADIAASTFGLSVQFLNSSRDDPALMSVFRVRVKVFYGDVTGHPWFYRRR